MLYFFLLDGPLLRSHRTIKPCLQLIVEKAELGDRDAIRAALDLFVDFVALFVRLLIILAQNAKEKDEREDRRRKRRGGR